jgi:hypothetical protein
VGYLQLNGHGDVNAFTFMTTDKRDYIVTSVYPADDDGMGAEAYGHYIEPVTDKNFIDGDVIVLDGHRILLDTTEVEYLLPLLRDRNAVPRWYVVRDLNHGFLCGLDIHPDGYWVGTTRTAHPSMDAAMRHLRETLGCNDFYLCLESEQRV